MCQPRLEFVDDEFCEEVDVLLFILLLPVVVREIMTGICNMEEGEVTICGLGKLLLAVSTDNEDEFDDCLCGLYCCAVCCSFRKFNFGFAGKAGGPVLAVDTSFAGVGGPVLDGFKGIGGR